MIYLGFIVQRKKNCRLLYSLRVQCVKHTKMCVHACVQRVKLSNEDNISGVYNIQLCYHKAAKDLPTSVEFSVHRKN